MDSGEGEVWHVRQLPEFFPYYVAMHSKPLTRRLHFAGTVSGLALSVLGLLTGRRRLLPAVTGS